MNYILYQVLHILFVVYSVVLFARALLPLLGMSYDHPVMRFLLSITEPLLAPIRRRLPMAGALDLSPMVLFILLWLLDLVLLWILL